MARAGQVFRTDRAIPAEFGDAFQDKGIVQFPMIRDAAIGHSGDLDMADQGQQGLHPPCHVALDDLDVVAIEHQAQIGRADLADDIGCKPGTVQEIAGRVIGVQRLDQDGGRVLCGRLAGKGKVADKG